MNTIYVDIDDVLCHTAHHLLGIIEREFGKRMDYEQLTVFDLGQACGFAPDELDHLLHLAHQPEELLRFAPKDKAIEVLRQWVNAGYEIAIVTGRPPSSYEPSLAWLERHQVPFHSLLMVDKYGRYRAEDTVGISLEDLTQYRFCWAVEDSAAMATYLAAQMAVPVALVDCPWNRACEAHTLISRYPHWDAIAQTLLYREDGG